MELKELTALAAHIRHTEGQLRGVQAKLERLVSSCPAEQRPLLLELSKQKPQRKLVRQSRKLKTKEDYERHFWSLVEKSDGCWIWKGRIRRGKPADAPRGKFCYFSRTWFAARLAWFFAHGTDPGKLCVCHRCDVSLCVNPAHLFLGTQAENVADMDRKGRRRPVHAERHRCAKLNRTLVAELRARVAAGESTADLARELGVRWNTVFHAVSGRSWRVVPMQQRAQESQTNPPPSMVAGSTPAPEPTQAAQGGKG